MKDCTGSEFVRGQKCQSKPDGSSAWPICDVLSVGDDTVSIRQADNPDCFSLLTDELIALDKWTIVKEEA